MKKVLFICSHLFSGSSVLYDQLNLHTRIQGFKNNNFNRYEVVQNIFSLTTQNHKLDSKAAVFMDELLLNHQFTCATLYDYCKFIYVIRNPVQTINLIIGKNKIKSEYAIRYYNFRMRRICEMAKTTKGAVLLTFDDLLLGKGLNVIEDYLKIPTKITFNPLLLNDLQKGSTVDLLEPSLRLEVEDRFERYLYFLKNQDLRLPQ